MEVNKIFLKEEKCSFDYQQNWSILKKVFVVYFS